MGRSLVVFGALSIALTNSAALAGEVEVKDLEVFQAQGITEIYVETSGPPTFQSFSKKSPPVLVVDLVNARGAPAAVQQPGGVIERLSFEDQRGRGGEGVSRMTLRFARPVRYDVNAERNIVRVRVFHEGGQAKPGPKVAMNERRAFASDLTSDADPVRLAQEDTAGASTDDGTGGEGSEMTYIGFNNREDESRVFARMSNETAKYSVTKEGENLMVLEIEDATIPLDNNKNYLDTTFFTSPVKMITPSVVDGEPPMIRITIEMKENVPYETKREGREIAIYFKK